jgi:hypothetical protein
VGRQRLLLSSVSVAALTTAMILGEVSVASAADGLCESREVLTGTCVNASIQDGGVALGGSQTTPGNGAPRPGGSASGPGNAAPVPDPEPVPPGWSPVPIRDGYTVTGPVRLTDLVNFHPIPGTSQMEPSGWSVLGVETNFYSRAVAQVQDGELLGQPASVRFTPVRYRWSYGDGAEALLRTGGGTWASQGIQEFDRTGTSHRYRAVGIYDVEHTIEFAAEYRYAEGDWTPIAGTIPIRANDLAVSIGGARTVLVARECTQNPVGSGC